MAPPRRYLRLLPIAGICVAMFAGLLALSWFHVLPGGWFLRNLLEDPADRAGRLRAEHREERLAAFRREQGRTPPGAVVFLGSSTIERYPLSEIFPATRPLNRGIGEETASELLTRLPGCVPADASGFVVYMGSVDFHRYEATGEQVAKQVATLLDILSESHSSRPVTVLGILPSRDLEPRRVQALSLVNRALRAITEKRGQTFLSLTRPPLVSPVGTLTLEYSLDRWHLNGRGYGILSKWIRERGGPVGRLIR